MKNSFSYYEILGLPQKASDEDIKRAYLFLAKKHHPDQNPLNRARASRNFQAIVEAYNALKTRERRAAYNQRLRSLAENDNKKPANANNIFSKLGSFLSSQNRAKETQK